MFNESLDFSNVIIDATTFSECTTVTIPFSAIIGQCVQWENYSTHAHNTYIWVIGLYYVLKIIKRFIWNPSWSYKWKGLSGKLNEKYKLYWFEELMDMCRMFLFFRIIQVWYVIKFVL